MTYLTQTAIYFLQIWTYHFFYGRGSDRRSEPIIIFYRSFNVLQVTIFRQEFNLSINSTAKLIFVSLLEWVRTKWEVIFRNHIFDR